MNPPAGPALRDIHLPAEPGWWPPAPGWWLLALASLLLLLWLARKGMRAHRRRSRRAALAAALQAVSERHPHDGAAHVAALSELMRRAALRFDPTAARLRDLDWLAYWDGEDRSRPFREGPGRLLLDGPFRRDLPAAQARALHELVTRRLLQWLEQHDA